jgi:hypothetical protein
MSETPATKTTITKVKYDGARVRVEYQKERADGQSADDFTLNCADRPSNAFLAALTALADDVVAICELPEPEARKLTVRGVSFTNTNDIFGAVITALKELGTANSPLVLNTPHLTEEPYGEGDDSTPLLKTETADRLHTLALEAENYINGDRAQPSLFVAGDREQPVADVQEAGALTAPIA